MKEAEKIKIQDVPNFRKWFRKKFSVYTEEVQYCYAVKRRFIDDPWDGFEPPAHRAIVISFWTDDLFPLIYERYEKVLSIYNHNHSKIPTILSYYWRTECSKNKQIKGWCSDLAKLVCSYLNPTPNKIPDTNNSNTIE